MKINGIESFNNINEYVIDKISRYEKQEKKFEVLFDLMFSEADNVMAETSDGFRIKAVTYGECKKKILSVIPVLRKELSFAEQGSLVGLYMDNSLAWIETFWAILACGYKPLLMNLRVGRSTLDGIIEDHNVSAVISDSEEFAVPTLKVSSLLEAVSLTEADADQMPKTEWGDEVLFMSSGTTNTPKLCAYNGENFYHQVLDSCNIIKVCPQMAKHYQGDIKILTLLPFYHVFGFIAVYLWFGFFARTFVFLKDLHPQTLLNTVKKHKVTHIFAVPLVWERIYKEAVKKIKARGDSTYSKFLKGLKLANSNGPIGTIVTSRAFKEIRDNIFGDSIRFLISGGSGISAEVLSFFNGIGYHMANGYGMTEIGITSVDLSSKKSQLNTSSVGAPFGQCQYKIQDGELWVRGKNMAARILQDEETVTDYDQWFCTHDLAREQNGKYYILGRRDDLIICKNGENLNPEIVEHSLNIPNCDELCIFTASGEPTLLISVKGIFTRDKLSALKRDAYAALELAGVREVISSVKITGDRLIQGDDFKISRTKISAVYSQGGFTLLDPDSEESGKQLLDDLAKRLRELFAAALQIDPDGIKDEADFFTDLGGSSLDYFMLLDSIKDQLGADCSAAQGTSLSSVKAFYDHLTKT